MAEEKGTGAFADNVTSGEVRKQGYLMKQGGGEGGTKNWKRRFFVLTDDLAYYENEQVRARWGGGRGTELKGWGGAARYGSRADRRPVWPAVDAVGVRAWVWFGVYANGVGSEITSFPRVPNSCVQPLLVGVAVLCLVAILTRRVYVISRRTTTRMLVLPQAYGKGQKAKGVISLNAFFCAKAEDAGKNEFTVYVRYWCMGGRHGPRAG